MKLLRPLLAATLFIGVASSPISALGDEVLNSPAVSGHQLSQQTCSGHHDNSFTSAINKIEPFVKRLHDGTFRHDAPSTILNEIPESTLAQISENMNFVNAQIQKGVLASTHNLDVYDPNKGLSQQSTFGGKTGLEPRWWGIKLFLDSYWSDKLIAAGNSAAGVLAVLVALEASGLISLPAALPTAVLAGAFAAAAGILSLCNGPNGMTINKVWDVASPPWCWEQ